MPRRAGTHTTLTRKPESAADILQYLTPDLIDFLADFHEAPCSLVQATVQLLPFGSRSALLATGLAEKASVNNGHLRLTPLAFAVMAEAAAVKDQAEISGYTERVRKIASELESR